MESYSRRAKAPQTVPRLYVATEVYDPLADLFFLLGWVTDYNGWRADLND